MKKGILSVIFLSVCAGCVEELKEPIGCGLEREFTASFEQDVKTSLDSLYNVSWSKNDTLSYYTADNGTISKCVVPFDCRSFSFTATVGEQDTYIIAAYGGTISDNTEDGLTLSGAVPEEQTGLFKDAHVAVCKKSFSDGRNLSFKNATSLIKFSLARTDVSYVTFAAADDDMKIHGNGKICFTFDEEGVPSAAFDENEGGSTIRVNTEGAGTFYIATLPCSIEGFSFVFYGSNGELLGEVATEQTLTLGANDIVTLGEIDTRIKIPTVDLSELGPANCFIVSQSGEYKFQTVMGNSNVSVGDVQGVKVLWESFGTSTKPSVGDLIKSDVSYKDGYITFSTNDTFKKGNAVIAAYSDSDCTEGKVLWSWHIWMTDKPEDQVYNNNAGTVMDRNLGATSVTPGEIGAIGLMYQWGRKDPFMGASGNSKQKASSTLSWPATVPSNASNGNIAYATAHPTTFITFNDYNKDWYYSGSYSAENERWQSHKTIYDPCPQGYRVPDGGENSVWASGFGSPNSFSQGPWDSTNKGMNFGSDNGKESTMQLGSSSTIWYPAAGYLNGAAGLLTNVGSDGPHWSSLPNEYLMSYSPAYRFDFQNRDGKKTVYPSNSFGYRGRGLPVRCVRDVNPPAPKAYTDLSNPYTANCYIVSEAGLFAFNGTVMGNSTESVGTPVTASVLWESFGTDVKPDVGDLVRNVTFSDGYVKFTATGKKGNAVIAVKDASDNILWSWHIWLTEKPEDQVYYNDAGTMMDRNLGATSAKKGDVKALGLMYQWGRKDPFLGSCKISYSDTTANMKFAESTLDWPETVESKEHGTIEYAVAHPTTFITADSFGNGDWYSSGSWKTDNTRWQSIKTKYDPCPPGYRVPDGGINGIWSIAFDISDPWELPSNWDKTNRGMDFGSTFRTLGRGTIWYPAAGGLYHSNGQLFSVGRAGFYRSCTTDDDYYSYYMYIVYTGLVQQTDRCVHSGGRSVRCVKDNHAPEPRPCIDLSAPGTANCYIVSSKGDYKFNGTVKGNSTESVGTPTKAEVLWETYGNKYTPKVGDLVKDVTFSDGYVYFTATGSKGNAVIAVKNAYGTILWSWHIWITDEPEDQVYNNNAGTMMDRNLGATSAMKGNVRTLGLLYQWGRKDPFLSGGKASYGDGEEMLPAASTGSWTTVVSDASKGTIEYAVAHPTTFISTLYSPTDWIYSGSKITNARWQKTKTMYDPCPAGYRVPDGGPMEENGIWSKAFGTNNALRYSEDKWDSVNHGMDFGTTDPKLGSGTIWYPAAGFRYYQKGQLKWVGLSTASYSSCSFFENGKDPRRYLFGFWSQSTVPSSTGPLVNAYPVRCLKDDSTPAKIYTNLSASGTANCYIVSSGGDYKFDASFKGNSTESVGTPAKAEVLWESFGTDTEPAVGDLVKDVLLTDEYVRFTATGKKGNAVIAVKNFNNRILWSWHIWITDKPKDQVYKNNAGTMMDRNLGATSAKKGDVEALGLLYQWGRKDPFLGSCQTSYPDSVYYLTQAASTLSWPEAVASDKDNGTIEYALNHPTTYITYNTLNYDWNYTGDWDNDYTRWLATKTMYDPCPPGYRVPDGGYEGIWSTAFGSKDKWSHSDGEWDSVNHGMDYGSSEHTLGSGIIWYPATGCRNDENGLLEKVGIDAHYLSSTCSVVSSSWASPYCLYLWRAHTSPTAFSDLAGAHSVRCIKE